MYKIITFIPTTHLSDVKNALFAAGAGRYKNYDSCCFVVKGDGEFRPLQNSNPFIGRQDEVSKVEEFRVEMICADHLIKGAIEALVKSHPYDEPAYDIIKLIMPEEIL